MTSYSDTGFLVKLYLQEPESSVAIAVAQSASRPILLSPLTFLEIRNALHLNVFQGRITEATRRAAWSAFEMDLHNGLHAVTPIPSADLYAKAAELADHYSAREGTRSLDLLHVAAALLLDASELLSFDSRQRKVAAGQGLKVRP